MPLFDLPLAQLRAYRAASEPPQDLAAFWRRTLEESRAESFPPRATPVDTVARLVRTSDVEFAGFGGHPIRAWLHEPADAIPGVAVARYQGYGSGRGLPHEFPLEVHAGYTTLVMDNRGQGGVHAVGDTADPVGSAPSAPGFLTRGIGDPDDHYYRRLLTDAVLAVDALIALTGAERIGVRGASQGGALALAAASLHPSVSATTIDVPFLSDLPRAIDLASTGPYDELPRFLAAQRGARAQALRTLSYTDVANLAPFATAPALFSVALLDTVCPPSTVFAAFHRHGATDKDIVIYPDNGHEGGGAEHDDRSLRWLRDRLA